MAAKKTVKKIHTAPPLSLQAQFRQAFAEREVSAQKHASFFTQVPSGAMDALSHANQSVHVVAPFLELVHKVTALAFALFVVLSVSMLVDPPLRLEVVAGIEASAESATHALGRVGTMSDVASSAITRPDLAYLSASGALSTLFWGPEPVVRARVEVQVIPITEPLSAGSE